MNLLHLPSAIHSLPSSFMVQNLFHRRLLTVWRSIIMALLLAYNAYYRAQLLVRKFSRFGVLSSLT
jgi:hypothetical protein